MKRPSVLALLVLVASCRDEPAVRPQWTVTLRTDAPTLVGDRLLVEIADDRGTAATRLIDASSAARWPISFGIAASTSPLRIRARLYRARATGLDGQPDPPSTIDARATLPAPPGLVVVPLLMACFGLATTAEESCDPTTGVLARIAPAAVGSGDATLLPGSWSESRSAPCEAPAPEGMVCVDGGLFFFGDGDPGVVREQLVRVSSFFVDQDELSVGRARALLAGRPGIGAPRRHVDDRSEASVCTYRGEQDSSNDDQALNCIDRDAAEQLCAADNKRLLTEAEFAYVAGNGARGSRYPWGDDEDICSHAVVARDALPPVPGKTRGELDTTLGEDRECRSSGMAATLDFGPVANAVPTRDETVEPRGVRNLSGNLSEWVQDTYASLADRCWHGRPLLVDPVCRAGDLPASRGAGWSFPPWAAKGRYRSSSAARAPNYVGVRCARDAAARSDR